MSFFDRFKKEPSKEDITALKTERLKLEERAKTRKDYYSEKDRISNAKKEIRQNSSTYRGFQKVKEGFSTLKDKVSTEGRNVPAFQRSKGNAQSFRNPFQEQQTFRNPTAQDSFRNPFGTTQATPTKKPGKTIKIVIK
jgi:hypothetical protein